MAKAVSDCLSMTEASNVEFRRSVGLIGGFSVLFHSLDESFNPGEEDDDIAEE